MVATPMALARAFTRRVKRNNNSTEAPAPARATTVKYPTGSINRHMISLPTELISTTNVDALNAPNIAGLNASPGSSINSSNDSDLSQLDTSLLGTPNLSADTSSIDSVPVTPITPLSPALSSGKGFFEGSVKRSATTASPRVSGLFEVPALPKRALSHSKKAHVELSRQRSFRGASPPPTSLPQAGSRRANSDIFSCAVDSSHPFHEELAKVNEVAEEFGVGPAMALEEQDMMNKGLIKFRAEDYHDEIAGLYGGIFEDQLGPLARPYV